MVRLAIILAGVLSLLVTALFVRWAVSTPSEEGHRQETSVYAAASLRNVLLELADHFDAGEKQKIRFNFAGSNVLAQQIVAANQADIFISANERWMDFVTDRQSDAGSSKRPFLANQLVVIANAASAWEINNPAQLAAVPSRYLSIGDPAAVPAGVYARQFLNNVPLANGSLWDHFESRVAPAPDVSAALNVVASDPEIIGVVYRTDAAVSDEVRVVYEVPLADGPAVQYFAAIMSRPSASANARVFFEYLFSEPARQVFRKHGFLSPETAGGT